MGLFDRIKRAFTGKEDEPKESEKVEEEKKEPKESDHEEISHDKESKAEDISNSEESEVSSKSEEPEQEQSDIPEEDSENSTEKTENVESESNDSEVSDNSDLDKAEVSEDSVEEKETEDATDTDSKESESDIEQNEESDKDDIKEYDEGLKKSRNSFGARFNRFLANFRSVDEEFFDDLEELLIESDVGYETAMRLSDELREEVKLENVKKRSDVSDVIVRKLVDMYDEEGKEEDNTLKFSKDKTPTVFLFVGVNGAGKTTTIGKLAHRYQEEGKKVLLAAGDTFRAGAIEQLQVWGKRVNVPVQASKAQTDPASVVFDAVHRAVNEDFDILLVDTAGRLQNKEGLMRELEKIKRVITRELPDAPQEVLLVLDGSTGQNALSQAKQFNETTDVSGIVLTKIDGSSQGGIVLAIRNELHIPVKLVGLGEQMDDLRDFDPEKFIYGLFKELIVGSGE